MSRRRLRSCVLPALLAASAGCGQLLGLGDFTNECGGALDAECAPGTGGAPPGTCNPGEKKPCYTGDDPLTEGMGICHGGMKTCGLNGLFGECEGEVLPKDHEDCDNALDDDCNGMVNDKCPCMQGEMHVCYSGDPATQDVGLCKGGMQTCNPAGDGFGACMGDVVPATVDDYTHTGDENCDGIPSADTLWVRTFDATGDSDAGIAFDRVVADPEGNVYVAGRVAGDAMLDGIPLSAPATGVSTGAFVAKFGADGTAIWAKLYDPGALAAAPIAFDAAGGRLVIAGSTTGEADFGAGALPAGSFVESLDADGHHVWSAQCTPFTVNGVGVDHFGRVTVAGWQSSTAAFNCGNSTFSMDPAAKESIVFHSFTADGDPVSVGGLTGPDASARLETFAVASGGACAFAGSLQGDLTTDGGVHVTGPGSGSILVGRLDGVAVKQLRVFGDGSSFRDPTTGPEQTAKAVAFDDAVNIYVTGHTAGTAEFGTTTLDSSGNAPIFVAALSPTLEPTWAFGLGDSGVGNSVNDLRVAATADLFVSSETYGNSMGQSANLIRRSKLGMTTPPAPTWTQSYGASGSMVYASSVTLAAGAPPAHDDVITVGSFMGASDFGTGVLPQTGVASAFLMRVAP